MKKTGQTFHGQLDNLSANGFAFLSDDKFFAQNKGAGLTIEIHDFALPEHNILEGRIIRCSDNDGMYIVGCQMPEDSYYIMVTVSAAPFLRSAICVELQDFAIIK